jgi:hypothetical protein
VVREIALLRPFSLAPRARMAMGRKDALDTLARLDLAHAGARFASSRNRMPYYRLVPKNKLANLLFRRRIIEKGYDNPEFGAAIADMCRHDILFWINTFGWTMDPRPRKGHNSPFGNAHCIPMITWVIQDAYVLELQDSIARCDILNEKSRDMGASWLGLYVLHWFWRFVDDCQFGLASRSDEYVDEIGKHKSLFYKIDLIDKMMPEWMLPPGRSRDDGYAGRKKSLLKNLSNGSAHNGESCTQNLFAGDRLTAMFLDEFSRFPTRLAFSVLSSTRDATTCRIFNGTSTGPGTAYHHVVTRTGCRRLRMHWTSAPLKRRGLYQYKTDGTLKLIDEKYWRERCQKELERDPAKTLEQAARAVYPFDEQAWARDDDFEYRSPWFDAELHRCANKSEALQELEIRYDAAQARFFDQAELDWHRKQYVLNIPVRLEGELDHTGTGWPSEFVVRSHGHWRLWVPLSSRKKPDGHTRYVIGADIAIGSTRGGVDSAGASNSVLSVVDRKERRLVAQYVNSGIKPDDFADLAVAACRWFEGTDGPAKLIWEANGPAGSLFGERIRALRYSNVYLRRVLTKIKRKATNEMGWHSDDKTKAIMLGLLRKALSRQGDFICPSGETLEECEQYCYVAGNSIEHSSANAEIDMGQARDNHGDRVISLGVCIVELDSDKIAVEQKTKAMPDECMERRDIEAEARTRRETDELWSGFEEISSGTAA